MIKEFLEILPKKITGLLLLILVFQFLLSYGLNYFSKINERKAQEMNSKINTLAQEYVNKFSEKDYKGVLHLIAIDYLITNRKKINSILENLPKYLPKNLKVNSLTIDNLNSKIQIQGNVPNWVEYAKIKKYFESKQDTFPNFKVDNISFNQQTFVIDLGISFNISPILYQQ